MTSPIDPRTDPAVDLILPTDCPVAELIPSIVDIALGSSAPATDTLQGWHLTRIGGEQLDASMTLREHGIHDGELMTLGVGSRTTRPRRPGDSGAVVAGAADQHPLAALPAAAPAACLTVTVVSAATLAWSGSTGGTSAHLWTAAGLSATAATGAVVGGRVRGQLPALSSLAAVVFAAVAGVLAVPGAPWAPASLLTGSAGFAVSILMLRMTSGSTEVLTALAAVTGTVAGTGGIAVTATAPMTAAAAILTVVSLGALSVAPKLTVAVAGLGPSRPDIGDRRAGIAHRVLTGLVAGWSASAVLGITTLAVQPSASAGLTALFAADVGLILILGQRTHIEARRRFALGTSGVAALLVAFAVVVSAAPRQAFWLCAAAAIAGVLLLALAEGGMSPDPVVRQSIQTLEYLSLAAVVPIALWVTGIYGLVRASSLP